MWRILFKSILRSYALTPGLVSDTSERQRRGEGEDEHMPLDGGKAYSLYDAVRRMLEPLRRDWEKFTPAEREVIITELEAFLRSVKPDENAPH